MIDNNPKYGNQLFQALPKFDRSVSWLGWAYNEETLIRDYLIKADELLRRTVEDYEIILIDDCSTDLTAEITWRVMRDIPSIRLIRNQANRNVGYSCKKAILSATKDYLFWQTVDWSYDISYLRIFLELLKSYDIAAGVRRAPVQVSGRFKKPILGLLKLFLPLNKQNFIKKVKEKLTLNNLNKVVFLCPDPLSFS